ncbi:hypothetical protein [Vibrio mangrovi]|uniref:Glycosyltransferase family 10 (Fucosyltransferase) n=1 Tax=Vibrio mangrovi TaxID=474394 RepID=A0A1Y6IV43_9VIBR|nr:hypothetical protein [Vibrio mangrovi]MDW6002190.1 hypothetical protein [Vibrio mangrovi]SMS01535.1 hypothetical protein VIM7927_02831 [Vibrio mangrovi]
MFVIHNPHSFDMLLRPLSYFFIKKKPHLKYQHLLQILFGSGPIYIALDYSESSLLSSRHFVRIPFFLRYLIVNIELLLWKLLNRKYKFIVIKNNKLKDKILFSFTYKGATHPTKEKYMLFDNVKGICFHLSHYMIQTKAKSDLIIKYFDKSVLMADVDLRNNCYYKEFFPSNFPFFIIPFQVSSRFIVKKTFEERKNKILISGTVHDLSLENPADYYQDFIGFFNSISYHEIRSKFFNEKKHNLIDSCISAFRQDGNSLQKEYFKIDLVEMLNDYKFVCYDKELSGAPAITTFEAISCGCIPLVHKDSFLGLELEDKVRFIEFGNNVNEFENYIENKFLDVRKYICKGNDFDVGNHMIEITKKNIDKIKIYFSCN